MPKPIDMIPGFGPTRTAIRCSEGWTVTVTPPEFMGLPPQSLLLDDDQFEAYQHWLVDKGGLIQSLLPDLTASEREILISGIGPEDFDRIGAEEED